MKTYQHNYTCVHFKLEEILPKSIYETLVESERLSDGWKYFPEKSLMMLDNLRIFFKTKIFVNNWKNKGQFQYRGLRTPECKEYSATSQHALGNAFDFDVEGLTAEQARKLIIASKDSKLLSFVGGIELNVGWIHIDSRPRFNGKIIAFDSKNKVSYI